MPFILWQDIELIFSRFLLLLVNNVSKKLCVYRIHNQKEWYYLCICYMCVIGGKCMPIFIYTTNIFHDTPYYFYIYFDSSSIIVSVIIYVLNMLQLLRTCCELFLCFFGGFESYIAVLYLQQMYTIDVKSRWIFANL